MEVFVKQNFLEKTVNIVKVLWVLFHIYAAWTLPVSINQLIVIHLGFAGVFVFHSNYEAKRKKESDKTKKEQFILFIWLLLFIVMLLTTVYFFFEYRNMINHIGTPTIEQIIAGATLIILVLLATLFEWGVVIPLLVISVSFYAIFGRHFGGILFHSGIDPARFIGYSATYFMGTLGKLTGYSVTLIIHFLVFGAILQAVGGSEAIKKIGKIIGSRFQSGAAQSAVISSSMMGMVSGSIPANVAITGSFTIPMMKNHGYSPEYAGAVEAVASAGGQIMPPIMSVVAFLIAGMTGISYAHIIIAAALPALVYYFSLAFNVFIRSQKINIQLNEVNLKKQRASVEIKKVFFEHGYLFIAVIVLTWRIVIGEAPPRAVFWGSLSLVILGLVNAIIKNLTGKTEKLKKSLIEYFYQVYNGLIKGADESSKIALVLASIGIIMETFTTTGFGQRLSYYIVTAGGELGSLILILLIALLVLFFGMGMPSAGAYLIAVLLAAPSLTRMGFELLSVHMFVFYFAILSALTPPVCLGVLVATSISGGNFTKTALIAIRLAIPGFLMPFFFLYKPAILHFRTNPLVALQFNLLLLLASFGVAVILEGHLFGKVGWLNRFVCLLGVLLILHPNILLSYFGAFVLILIFVLMTFRNNFNNLIIKK